MDSSADDAPNLFDMSGRQRPGSYSMGLPTPSCIQLSSFLPLDRSLGVFVGGGEEIYQSVPRSAVERTRLGPRSCQPPSPRGPPAKRALTGDHARPFPRSLNSLLLGP